MPFNSEQRDLVPPGTLDVRLSAYTQHPMKAVPMSPHTVRRLVSVGIVVLALASGSWRVTGAGFDSYRDFALRTSTADIIARAQGSQNRDVKTLHTRPALLQELLWRPLPVSGPGGIERDSVARVTFSFIDGQLFRMLVDYDQARTEGLTTNDMVASLSTIYGPRATPRPGPRRSAYDSLDALTKVAEWREGDTAITLNHSAYANAFGLVITSAALEAAAVKAEATAVAMDAREAPAREAARVKDAAAAAKATAEKTRTDNKATFQP